MVSDGSDVPIDIHAGKLMEWLQSRRHCGKEWQKSALEIREKISAAIQDMPEHEIIKEMLSGTYVTYFHCRQIVDVLMETEAKSKNVFGRYSSQRMKDWQEILRSYEKDNVYLIEAAQILQQFVQYEIPALKRQVVKCQANEQECQRKEVDYEKLSRESERVFRQECQKMNVDHSQPDLKRQLLHLSDTLPDRFDKFTQTLRHLSTAVVYYMEFRRLTVSDAQASPVLPLLRIIQQNGNVTVYEWRHGVAPASIERVFASETKVDNEEEDVIDFGLDTTSDDVIDFGIQEVSSGDAQEVDAQADDRVARLDEALTVLESNETLSLLISDLKELDAFLMLRHLELDRQQAAEFLFTGGAASDVESKEKAEDIKNYRSEIKKCLEELNDSGLKNLRKLRVSPVYAEQMAENMKEPIKRSEKYKRMALLMKEKQVEHRNEAADAQVRAELLVKRAKELQKQIESDISKRYQNRPVNIVGSAVNV